MEFLVSFYKHQSIRFFRSHADFLLSRIIFIILDVFSERSIEQNWFLTNHPQLASQVMNIEVFDVDAVYGNLAWLWEIKSLQKLYNGWFSTSWWAYKCNLLSR